MPLTGNPSHDIPVELAAGKPRQQAIAIAMNEKRSHGHDADATCAVMKDGKVLKTFSSRQAAEIWQGNRGLYDTVIKSLRSDAKGDACPKCEGSGTLKNGDRCLRCMGTGVQGAADAKGDGMNAHLDPGSHDAAEQPSLKELEGQLERALAQGKNNLAASIRKAIQQEKAKRGDGPSTGTLMDILRGDSERRAKTVDMLIEASHSLTKRAAKLFDRK